MPNQKNKELAKCSSERLDTLRSWVGVATLRSLKVDAVPDELQAEPLNRKPFFLQTLHADLKCQYSHSASHPRPIPIKVIVGTGTL